MRKISCHARLLSDRMFHFNCFVEIHDKTLQAETAFNLSVKTIAGCLGLKFEV